jgi:hypothetical protein
VDKKENQCSAGMNITNMVTGGVLIVLVIFACCTLAWVLNKIRENKIEEQINRNGTEQELSSRMFN